MRFLFKCTYICYHYYFYTHFRKLSDGLFLETSKRIAKEYPDIEHNEMIIDNCCMQLVSNPHQFDVMIMTNLYGTIVSNVICGLVGGAGLLSGKNYGDHVSLAFYLLSDLLFLFILFLAVIKLLLKL